MRLHTNTHTHTVRYLMSKVLACKLRDKQTHTISQRHRERHRTVGNEYQ